MAVPYRVYCGTLRSPGATGSQAVTGVGFTPKALIIWSVNTAQAGVPEFNDFNYWSFGLTDGTTHVAKTSISFDGAATTDVNHSVVTDAVILAESTDGTVQHRATLTSLDSDGFTINWTNIFASEQRRYHFIAIGGSEVSCKVGVFNANTSTGAQAVTGVGFKPVGMLFAPAQNAGTSEDRLTYPALGWTDGTNQFASAVFSDDGNASANTKRYQRIDKCAALLDNAAGGVVGEAGITSFDTDGFTVNWTTAAASALRVYYLAFKGIPFKVGSLTQPSASGSQAVTGLGFQPGVVVLQSVNAAASTSVQDELDFSLGAAMARHTAGVQTVTQRSIWMGDKDAADPMQSARYYSEALVWAAGVVNATGPSSTLAASAAVASFTCDGFTLTHTADGTQRQIGWVAFSSPHGHRNVVSGYDHEHYGHDNVISGRANIVIGNNNHVHGSEVTVKGNRNTIFSLDGVPRTIEGDDKFWVYGDFLTTAGIQRITATSYTVASGAPLLFDPTASATINLPAGSSGFTVRLKNISDLYVCTLDGNSTELIFAPGTVAGRQTFPLMPGASIELVYLTGTDAGWHALKYDLPPTLKFLSNTDNQNLPDTPVELVPAPGADWLIVPKLVTVHYSVVSGFYTNINTTWAALQVCYDGNSGPWANLPIVNDSTVTPAIDALTRMMNNAIHDGIVFLPLPYVETNAGWWLPVPQVTNGFGAKVNKNLALSVDNNGSGDWTGGHANSFARAVTDYGLQSTIG